MKRYLIDESTFKKFVAKVKSSADGEKVTAVVNQPKHERFLTGIRVNFLSEFKSISASLQLQKV